MAGISIFFITTYFSDYILVPLRCRGQVISALEERGFGFEKNAEAYINHSHQRNTSTNSSIDSPTMTSNPPSTPPPATVSELQTRTFATLRKRNIEPTVNESIRLVQCSAAKVTGTNGSLGNSVRGTSGATDDRLHIGLVRCLISRPSFLSITLTDTEPASILLEERLLFNFDRHNARSSGSHINGSMESVLLGNKEDVLVPIILDLRDLPTESTGIVCGIAGRLVGGTRDAFRENVEMSYLSTAKAGTVMVPEGDLDRAMEAFRGMKNGMLPD
ncbi:hypothetical protein LTS18_005395 [Coniosporium uncinatum]|uniref:Uncharacterized protein n=1 Tax=Coniosporium uncinatum TaxID=93489 RepID=A0ACC3DRI1_9PEZI|nr:hypothetical protein LTS18_005395 [Coniosporium uncinatum]